MYRKTLVKIMKALYTAGGVLLRSKILLDVLQRSVLASKLNAILNQPWPRGLMYLVTEEKIKGPRQPLRRWVLTRIGRELLQRLEVNGIVDSSAMPDVPPYMHFHKVESALARDFQLKRAAERRRAERWRIKRQWRGRTKYPEEVYNQFMEGSWKDIPDKEFRKLTPLERIRLLRSGCGLNRRKKSDSSNESL